MSKFLTVTSIGVILIATILFPPFQRANAETLLENPIAKSIDGKAAAAHARSLAASYSQPILFVENQGQYDPHVRYQVRINHQTIWLTDNTVVFDLVRTRPGLSISRLGEGGRKTRIERLSFSERFVGATQPSSIETIGSGPRFNFFKGDKKDWRTGLRSYSGVIYRDLWQGIDLKVYSKDGVSFEQEFLVHPNADTKQIKVQYDGIEKLHLGNDGALDIDTKMGTLTELAPTMYRSISGGRQAIAGGFEILSKTEYSFRIDSASPDSDLILDPPLLYSTFAGGSNNDAAQGVAVDSAGNAYVTGYTYSLDFPTTIGAQQIACPSPRGSSCSAAFVLKFDPAGNLSYATFLGGSNGGDAGNGVAVNSNGEAYITGNANPGFPLTASSNQQYCYASTFLSKLTSAGDGLLYSSCFGQNNIEYAGGGIGIALDASGKAYIAGSAIGVPTTANAYQGTNKTNGYTGFLAVIDPNLSGSSSLLYSTYLGGSKGDQAYGVAVDSFNKAYISGATTSADFPTTPGAYQRQNHQQNAFVAKFDPSQNGPSSLIYSTLIGGSNYGGGDSATGIAVDPSGSAYITGIAGSSDFPTTTGVLGPEIGQFGSTFVAKFNPGGSLLTYSTLIPGSAFGTGIRVDSQGHAYIVGYAKGRLQVTPDAFQTVQQGGDTDAFLSELNSDASAFSYSTYLGGRFNDYGYALALDSVGDVYVAGSTASPNFPITPGNHQLTIGGQDISGCPYAGNGPVCLDAFLTKFPLGAEGGLSVSGIAPNRGGNAGSVTAQIFGSGFHAGAAAMLSCGEQTIAGASATPSISGKLLTLTFDLTSLAPGICDVWVKDLDGTSKMLAQAFAVQLGGAASIQVSIAGTVPVKHILDGPSAQTYFLQITNNGMIDAPNTLVGSALNSPFLLANVSPIGLSNNSGFTAAGQVSWLANLGASASANFLYSGLIPLPTPVGTPIVGGPVFAIPDEVPPFPNPLPPNGGTSSSGNSLVGLLSCLSAGFTQSPQACGVAAAACGQAIYDCQKKDADKAICFFESATCALAATQCKAVSQCLRKIPPIIVQPLEGGADDPNSLNGPQGFGAQRWILPNQSLQYVISFGNEPTATAPAQQVNVTEKIDSNLDASTLSLIAITIPNGDGSSSLTIPLPNGAFAPVVGLNEYATIIDLRPTQSMLVGIDAKLNPTLETITWAFTSIDPLTGQPYPLNLSNGFLPPASGASVLYSIKPAFDATTGTQISSGASVVFNTNPAINTNVWTNTIDNTPPASQVGSLPSVETTSNFPVSWSGSDVGSGVGSYAIYVSDNGGPFNVWQGQTTGTSAIYMGMDGHTYGFYSIATDNVGNVESTKTLAEANTTVRSGSQTCATDMSSQFTITRSGFRLDHTTNLFVQSVGIRNNGSSTTSPLLVLDGLTPGILLSNAGGSTQCATPLGSPWLPLGPLTAGGSTTLNLSFSDPGKASILYSTRILGGDGQP